MKKKKSRKLKYIFIGLLGFMSFLSVSQAATYTNYNNIVIKEDEYSNLINLGFSSDEIYYMDLNTFNNNKNLNAILLTKNIKYYKSNTFNNESTEITANEYFLSKENTTRGTVNTEYKNMVSTISLNGSKYRYKVSLSWKQMPKIRSYDIIGIGFSDNIKIDSSVYFNYYYCNSSGTCTTKSEYFDKKSISTGGSAVFKFPREAVSMSATLFYDVAKKNNDTINNITMCGDYSHATSNVSINNISDYTININGLVLGSSIYNKYDSIPCAKTTLNVNW